MLVLTILIFILFMNDSAGIIGVVGLFPCTIQCIVIITSVVFTEFELKRVFTDNGERK